MDMDKPEFYITATLMLLLLIANIHASYLIFKTNEVSRSQKVIQLAIVWLIPVMAVVSILIYRKNESIKMSDRYMGQDIDEHIGKYGPGGKII